MATLRTSNAKNRPKGAAIALDPMRCFVAMPFKGFDELYTRAIEPAVEGCFGKGSARAATRRTAQVVGDRIAEEIIWSDVVMAVITDNNPNVMYEIGIAHSLLQAHAASARPAELRTRAIRSCAARDHRIRTHPGIGAKHFLAIQKALKPYLVQIRDDPHYEASNLLTRLIGHKYYPYVDDFRGGKGWLLGYLDVLRLESTAETVWEINPDSHWLAEDPLFFDRIKASIRDSSRKYYYIIPDQANDVQGMKQAFHGIAARLDAEGRRRLGSFLKYVAIDPAFFELMPLSVVIYNATSSPKEAILLRLDGEPDRRGQVRHPGESPISPQLRRAPHRWEGTVRRAHQRPRRHRLADRNLPNQ
jgi:hypothetical protein